MNPPTTESSSSDAATFSATLPPIKLQLTFEQVEELDLTDDDVSVLTLTPAQIQQVVDALARHAPVAVAPILSVTPVTTTSTISDVADDFVNTCTTPIVVDTHIDVLLTTMSKLTMQVDEMRSEIAQTKRQHTADVTMLTKQIDESRNELSQVKLQCKADLDKLQVTVATHTSDITKAADISGHNYDTLSDHQYNLDHHYKRLVTELQHAVLSHRHAIDTIRRSICYY
jgi:hypothetical protein